jgi:hypothetical protein
MVPWFRSFWSWLFQNVKYGGNSATVDTILLAIKQPTGVSLKLAYFLRNVSPYKSSVRNFITCEKVLLKFSGEWFLSYLQPLTPFFLYSFRTSVSFRPFLRIPFTPLFNVFTAHIKSIFKNCLMVAAVGSKIFSCLVWLLRTHRASWTLADKKTSDWLSYNISFSYPFIWCRS